MTETEKKSPKTIDEYIAAFPEEVQLTLQEMRATIHAAAPQAQETIKYGIPTFTLEGNLVHFGGYQKHIGFYPTPSALEHFADDLSQYEGSKGAVKFPLDQPIPYDLVRRMVAFRVQENREKAAAKKKRKG